MFVKKCCGKFITFMLTFLMLFQTFASSAYIVKASELSSQVFQQQKQEQELAEILDFMFNNAVVYDSNGYVKDIDFAVIYDKYGYSSDLAKVEKIVFADKMQRADAGHCAIVAIQDTLGVSALTGLIGGGIVGLLQRKAAAEIAKLIVKVGFKNVVPAAIAASLIWSFGRCMWF